MFHEQDYRSSMLRVDAPAWTPTTTVEFALGPQGTTGVEYMSQQDVDQQAYWGQFAEEMYDDFSNSFMGQASDSTMDMTGGWMQGSSQGYYEQTTAYGTSGAWLPTATSEPQDLDAALQARLSKLGLATKIPDPQAAEGSWEDAQSRLEKAQESFNRELEARTKAAALHPVKLQDVEAPGLTKVAAEENGPPPREGCPKDSWVPNSMCWDMLKVGTCERGMACPWRHTVLGVVETEEQARMRRERVMHALRAAPSPSSNPADPVSSSPWWMDSAGDKLGPENSRRGVQPLPPGRDWSGKQSFDKMFETPPKQSREGGQLSAPSNLASMFSLNIQDKRAKEENIPANKQEPLFGCTVEHEEPGSSTWQPPSWAAVVKTAPGNG